MQALFPGCMFEFWYFIVFIGIAKREVFIKDNTKGSALQISLKDTLVSRLGVLEIPFDNVFIEFYL